jgi:Mrr N-terminal domain
MLPCYNYIVKEVEMMPTVRITDQTWERLKKWAVPLEDTPNDAISKVLDLAEKVPQAKQEALPKAVAADIKAKKRKQLTPQKDFRRPLMQVIRDLGGRATTSKVRPALLKIIQSDLLDGDYYHVSSGDERWWNAACWERKDLVEEGLFERNSPRGVWALSEAGYEAIKSG